MQGTETKHLRCIGLPDHAAINGLQYAAVFVDALEGVPRRDGQQATDRIGRQLAEQGIEVIPGQVRPGGVVHQHPIVIVRPLFVQVQQGIEH